MDHAEAEIEGLSDGADDYLGKPFDLEVLAARARRSCAATSSARPGSSPRASCAWIRPAAPPGGAASRSR